MVYNYNKLKGKIREVCGTQEKFALALERTDTTINNKLNNKTYFTQDEISKAIEVLNITSEEIYEYFFNQKVE